MDQLCTAVGTSDQVEVHRILPPVMKGWNQFEDKFYKKTIKDSLTTKSHVFTVKKAAPTILECRADANADPVCLQMLKKGTNTEDRVEKIRSLEGLHALTPPGIKPIKEVELGTKWQKLVPRPFRDAICPRVSKEKIKMVRGQRNKKKAAASTALTRLLENKSEASIDEVVETLAEQKDDGEDRKQQREDDDESEEEDEVMDGVGDTAQSGVSRSSDQWQCFLTGLKIPWMMSFSL